jgi:hypothetical protein
MFANHDTVLGPDSETWLPQDPFHAYEGPYVYGPGTDGENQYMPASTTTTDGTSLSETLINLSFRRAPEQGHDERTHEQNMWITRTREFFLVLRRTTFSDSIDCLNMSTNKLGSWSA